MITGDLVHMKIDGDVLESTLGVVTGSLGDDNYRILWLDDASGAQGTWHNHHLQRINDEEEYQEYSLEDW